MKRALAVLVAVTALVAGACGASGSDEANGDDETTTTEADGGGGGEVSDASFGDIEGLCGDGDFTVEPSEAGLGTDKLYIGVANDRSAELRPGLNKVMYDAGVAFAGWCNDQGGIGGLPIEIVDLDAALFNVEAAMTTACNDVFAMVGGGLAQDALMFSGKEGSDFHMCDMIDIPGFAVSAEKADSNGQVQPIPNPGGSVANTWFNDFATIEPDAASQWTVVWGELPSLEIVKTKYSAAVADVSGMENVGEQSYPVVGITDWTPYAQKMIGTGATSFSWVGEVENLNGFLKAARQQGWDGTPLLETNMYDQKLLTPEAEGTLVRMQLHALEEADEWPAIQKYLDIVDEYVEGGETGALGIQSMSAWLLFATAANACGELNDGVLDRTCILEQSAEVEDWTGGGLHAPQDPARYDEAVASPCSMLLIVKDGEFTRLYPELGGEGDDIDGFHCPDDGVTEVTADVGEGKVDPDRPI
jgi:hypothetical protein